MPFSSKEASALTPSAFLDDVKSSPTGLSSSEASDRLKRDGPNVLAEKPLTPLWATFLEQFKSLVVAVLLVALLLSAWEHQFKDAAVIAVVLVVNAILGTYQEHRAESAIAALKKLSTPVARVFRDLHPKEIPARDVVMGDVLFLAAGDRVNADARIVESSRFAVDESILTGESVASEKNASALYDDKQLTPANLVFSETLVVRGTAKAVVYATGVHTQLGQISETLQATEEGEVPLKARLDEFMQKWSAFIFILCIGIVVLGSLFSHRALTELIRLAIAQAADQDNSNRTTDPLGEITLGLAET